jgi:hypothetical protein
MQAPIEPPELQITSVERADTRELDPLIRFGIDQPATPTHRAAYDFLVAGWVLHPERRVVSVQVMAGDEAIGWGPVQLPRSDIEKAFPNVPHARGCGFHLAASAIGLPRAFDCALEVNLDDGRRIPVACIRGTRSPVRVDQPGTLQPVIVTSLGRSGSTFLMGLLAGHPEIAVDRKVPYETRVSSYWTHVFKVLSRPANHARAGDLDTFVYNRHFVGQNPFNAAWRGEPPALREWYGLTAVEKLAAFCRENIDSFYRVVAELNGQQRARYFAEKRLGRPVRNVWAELYPRGREIFLVRDFRDMVASTFAFNAKRGYLAFGRQEFSSDEEYVRRLEFEVREMQVACEQRAADSLLVRYEDLVRSPHECLATILEYLHLDRGRTVVDAMVAGIAATPELRFHRTSSDGNSSIGRWQGDLDPQLQRICEESFASALAQFGYAVPVE